MLVILELVFVALLLTRAAVKHYSTNPFASHQKMVLAGYRSGPSHALNITPLC